MNKYYCFFCSSDLDTDIEFGMSKCYSCGAKYELDLLDDCIRAIKVNMCGTDCKCEIPKGEN